MRQFNRPHGLLNDRPKGRLYSRPNCLLNDRPFGLSYLLSIFSLICQGSKREIYISELKHKSRLNMYGLCYTLHIRERTTKERGPIYEHSKR